MKAAFCLIACLALISCAPEPAPAPAPVPPPPDNGLTEREPNTCGRTEVEFLRGQPGTVVPSSGITRDYRVIQPGSIITQEYNSARVNFYLDEAGIIARISCG